MPPDKPMRRKNVSQACINCRQRKKRCDGGKPVCGACHSFQDECNWDPRLDLRRSIPRHEGNALRERIAELERIVGDQGAPLPGTSAPRPVSRPLTAPLPSTAMYPTPSASGAESITEDIDDCMVKDHRGIYRYHLLSSAYRHDGVDVDVDVDGSGRRNSRETTVSSSADRWRRFLPDFHLTKQQHDTAIDRCFRYFTSWAQRVTPHLFYRDMEQALPLAENDLFRLCPNYSPFLHNIVLALGLAFADEEHLRADSTRKIFRNKGVQYQDRECAKPCVATVQALALLGSFEATMGNYSLGWIVQGTAVRLCYAMALQLNQEKHVAGGELDVERFVERNVTFWSTLCQEGLWACYIGRRPMMTDYSLPLLSADKTTDDIPWTWPPGPLSSLPPQKSYLSLTLTETARLVLISNEIISTIYPVKRRDHMSHLGSNMVQKLHDQLDSWSTCLPRELRIAPGSSDPVLPHILMIHLAWAWFLNLLYQPFSKVVSPDRDATMPMGKVAMQRCHEAALQIIRLANLWDEQHSLRFTPPTMSSIIYSAGISFLLVVGQSQDFTQAATAWANANTCLEYLDKVGKTWKAGQQQARILRGQYERWPAGCIPVPDTGEVRSSQPEPHVQLPDDSVQQLLLLAAELTPGQWDLPSQWVNPREEFH